MRCRDPQCVGRVLASLVLFVAVATGPTGCSQVMDPGPRVGPAAGAPAPGAALLPLWRVSRGEHEIYLLGSMHLLRPSAHPLDTTLYAAFDAAELIVFEVDFSRLMSAGPQMRARGSFDDGRRLPDVVPDSLYDAVTAAFRKMSVPDHELIYMKPWFAATTLSLLTLERAGFQSSAGVDMHFFRRAAESGRRLAVLETVDQQLEVFDGLSMMSQVAFLRSTVSTLDDAAARLDEGIESWKRGDADALALMNLDGMAGQPELVERLVFERNRRWLPVIESLLASSESALVVVGAGHLVGDGSVLELLRGRGYEVTQIGSGELD